MKGEYGPYADVDGWIIAAYLMLILSFVLIALSLIAKKSKAVATLSNKHALTTFAVIIVLGSFLSIGSCVMTPHSSSHDDEVRPQPGMHDWLNEHGYGV